jgi:hypothetical protein
MLFYFLNSYALTLGNIIIDAAKCCPINNGVRQELAYPERTRPVVARQQVQNLPTGFSVSSASGAPQNHSYSSGNPQTSRT